MHLDCHALPADLRLSHGNVARPRDILARAGTQPLREANVAASMLVFVAQLLLAFTHEGTLVLLLAIVATLAPRGLRSTPFVRAATCLIIILIMATISKIAFPPDDYYASAFWRAALHFFDLEIFKVRVVLLLLAALIAYGAILATVYLVTEASLRLRARNLVWIAFRLLAVL